MKKTTFTELVLKASAFLDKHKSLAREKSSGEILKWTRKQSADYFGQTPSQFEYNLLEADLYRLGIKTATGEKAYSGFQEIYEADKNIFEMLDKLARSKGRTKKEIISHASGLYSYLHPERPYNSARDGFPSYARL